jgi:hypothetical protein
MMNDLVVGHARPRILDSRRHLTAAGNVDGHRDRRRAPVRAAPTWRFPRDTNTDTPLPPEEPAGKNPPDGAILYYYLKSPAAGPMTIEVLDAASKVVAHFSSEDKAPPPNLQLNVPKYWLRPFQPLSAGAGMHRFIWDLHGSPAAGRGGRGGEPPISAVYMDTPVSEGPWMPAGTYTVKLTVNGRSYEKQLVVKPDPRH